MSKWPELKDRDWPVDLPMDYLIALERGGNETLKATAMVSVVLGLMRRIEKLERQINPP